MGEDCAEELALGRVGEEAGLWVQVDVAEEDFYVFDWLDVEVYYF